MTERFLTVRTTTRYENQVPAYLYSTAALLPRRVQVTSERSVLLVQVTAPADQVEYLANYQASRLSSGGHYATVHADRPAALADLAYAVQDY
jgi:hypothetical protein